MSKLVKEFQLFGDILEIKDEYARNKIDTLDSKVDNIKVEVVNNVSGAKRYGNFYHAQIRGNMGMVANENGELSDMFTSSGEGTYTVPYNTLDDYASKLNSGETHLDCTIRQSGVYRLKQPIISDCILNITVECDDVEIILNMSDADMDFIMCNSYINIQSAVGCNNVILHTPTNNHKIYVHNGSLILNRVTYEGCIVGYGSYVHIYNSNIGRLELNGCNGHLSENKITNKDNRYNGISILRGSNMELGGVNADFADLNENGGSGASMVRIEGSSCALQYAQNVATNYLYGITANSATLYCTKARLDSFANSCANGNNISNSIVVTQNIGL